MHNALLLVQFIDQCGQHCSLSFDSTAGGSFLSRLACRSQIRPYVAGNSSRPSAYRVDRLVEDVAGPEYRSDDKHTKDNLESKGTNLIQNGATSDVACDLGIAVAHHCGRGCCSRWCCCQENGLVHFRTSPATWASRPGRHHPSRFRRLPYTSLQLFCWLSSISSTILTIDGLFSDSRAPRLVVFTLFGHQRCVAEALGESASYLRLEA